MIVLESGQIKLYRIWNHYYSRKSIEPVLNRKGFLKHKFFSDITGAKFFEGYDTLAIVTRKGK